jgi:L-fuculose-phosphate aldolase
MYLDNQAFRVAAARRMLHREGCSSGIAGQVSERDAIDPEAFWTSPFGFFEETLPKDIQKLDKECQVLPGGNTELAVSPAIGFHQGIYQARPDVKAVIHTHTKWMMIFAATDLEVAPYNYFSQWFQGQQARLNAPLGKWDGDPELVAAELGEKNILFLQHHGVITVGASLEEAFALTINLERMAEVHAEVNQLGGYPASPEKVAQTIRIGAFSSMHAPEVWAAQMRRMRRTDPELFDWVLDTEFRVHGYVGALPDSDEWRHRDDRTPVVPDAD